MIENFEFNNISLGWYTLDIFKPWLLILDKISLWKEEAMINVAEGNSFKALKGEYTWTSSTVLMVVSSW